MAEARAVVDNINIRVEATTQLDASLARAKLRGVQVQSVEGGIVIVVPSPKHLARIFVRNCIGLYNHFVTACWPAPVWLVMTAITALIGYVVKDDGKSWLRSGPVATYIWDLDTRFTGLLGLSNYLPLYFRIAYLSAWCSIALMLVVALMQRLSMRTLLNYRGWMYEKKVSITTMVWGGLLRGFFLGQRSPLTYSFQSAMPRLPVPALKDTIRKYLETVRPLISDDEYVRLQKEGKQFELSTAARKCQAILVLKSWLTGNYVSDWWEKYVYLRGRSPILINSNYYGLGYAYHIPTPDQTARAAVLLHWYAHFKNMLDDERLTPTTVRGAVPICMRQYHRFFCLTREPGRDTDVLRHYDSLHVAVQFKGTWWRLNCFTFDKKPLSIAQLKHQLDFIVSAVGSAVPAPAPSSAEACLPALTALNRTRWAEIREDYLLRDVVNRVSLEEVETSMFVLHLDHRSTGTLSNQNDWTTAGKLALHGGGTTRWCDKSFNLCVYANGDAAVHAEHSWADAPVIAHGWEWVLCKEAITTPYGADGVLAHKGEGAAAKLERPVRLEWRMFDKVAEAVLDAARLARDLCEDLVLI
jgi:carnitine O-palmitoyltransferase 1